MVVDLAVSAVLALMSLHALAGAPVGKRVCTEMSGMTSMQARM